MSFFVAFADSKKTILTQQGLFTEEEFLENKAVIGKQSLLSTILYYEYVMKDESGNLIGAQRLLQDFMDRFIKHLDVKKLRPMYVWVRE